jgi:hypothetical protein
MNYYQKIYFKFTMISISPLIKKYLLLLLAKNIAVFSYC